MYRKDNFGILGMLLLALLLMIILWSGSGCSVTVKSAPASTPSVTQPKSTTHHQAAKPKATHQTAKPTHHVTVGQAMAMAKAKFYLEKVAPFSKKGLQDQLEFEHFKPADAKYAVNHISVNWKTQAYKKAEFYLKKVTPLSEEALVGQLEYEHFTHAQAVYGAHKAYHE